MVSEFLGFLWWLIFFMHPGMYRNRTLNALCVLTFLIDCGLLLPYIPAAHSRSSVLELFVNLHPWYFRSLCLITSCSLLTVVFFGFILYLCIIPLNTYFQGYIWAGLWGNMSYAICKQQRCRSACASAQSDQRLCCLLPRYFNLIVAL